MFLYSLYPWWLVTLGKIFQPDSTSKHVSISPVLLGFLLGTGLAGAASVGTLPLILQDKSYKALLMAIDTDTQETKTSITTL